MMWRLIFLGIAVWVAIYYFKRYFKSTHLPKTDSSIPATDESNNEKNVETMVQCSHCAVHLPRSEAYLVEGDFYCSKAHIQKK